MNWSSHEFIWLDWVVLIIGLFGVVAAVWYAIWKDKKAQQGEDSSAYLFGKGEPWYVIGMAIFAANIGSEHLVGLAGTGAKDGVGMAHWEMQGWMILILGWLFVPFYQLLINKMGKIITMPDFLKFRRLVAQHDHLGGIRSHQGISNSLHWWYLLQVLTGHTFLVWCNWSDCHHSCVHRVRWYEGCDDPLNYPDPNPYCWFIPGTVPWFKHAGRR